MSKVNDKHLGVARVYSRALLGLAEAEGRAAEVLVELGAIVGLMERDEAFAAFMASPLVDAGERERTLERLFRGKLSDLMVDALQVLNRKGRLDVLATLCETYRREHQDHVGVVDVHVTTAVPLSESLREKLRLQVGRRLGKEAHLMEEVDEAILGGLVLRIGDQKVDASIGRQIREIRARVHLRGSHHIHAERLIAS